MHPFAHIPAHVKQAKAVGTFLADLLLLSTTVVIPPACGLEVIPTAVGVLPASATGVFPFCFAGQTPTAAIACVQPANESLRIVPGDAHHWRIVAVGVKFNEIVVDTMYLTGGLDEMPELP
jgi:hypothetical protein